MLIERLKTLCRLPGISSREDAVRAQLREWTQPYADAIEIDSMGNLYVFKRGVDASRTCMFAAHMDEVGFMVTSVEEDGTLRFTGVGGIDERIFPGMRVRVGEAMRLGVIGVCPPHLCESCDDVYKLHQLIIDIGAKNAADALTIAQPGDAIYFDGEPVTYGDEWLCAKALDDRTGCAVLSMLAAEMPACNTWLVFTAQEEVGVRGATVAAYRVKPGYAFVVENTTAADLQDVPPHKAVCRPGSGVVIPFMDTGTIYTPALVRHLQTLADNNSIQRQTKEYIAGGTDARAIQRSRGGVPTAGMAVASRSIHSPISAIKLADAALMHKLALLAYTTPWV